MKKTTIALLTLLAANSAFAATSLGSSLTTAAPAATTAAAPSSSAPPAPVFLDSNAHLDKTITLSGGSKVYIYNGGAEVDVVDAKGNLGQSSAFGGYSISLQHAMNFLAKLQQAVKTGNKQAISNMVRYPLKVTKTLTVHNASEFMSNYDQIFTSDVTNAIINQEPYTLFSNSQGVMIGSGQVWFNAADNNNLKGKIVIIAVNTNV